MKTSIVFWVLILYLVLYLKNDKKKKQKTQQPQQKTSSLSPGIYNPEEEETVAVRRTGASVKMDVESVDSMESVFSLSNNKPGWKYFKQLLP